MKKKRKNIITLIAIFVAVGILITGGILAYLTDTNQKTNVFTVGSIKINLTEANWNSTNGQDIIPGDVISKDPKIDNVGKNSAYVYMKVEQPNVTLSTGEGPLFDYTPNTGWTLLGTNQNQGCPTTTSVYYYNTALSSNSSTTTLFDEVTINDFTDLTDTYPMEIVVTGYAIQSSYLPNGTTIQSAYNTYFSNSGLASCDAPIIKPTSYNDTTAFRNATYKENIKTITLDDHINEPANIIESWDIGVSQNGNVMAYITQNSDDNTMYDLYIQGNGKLYANPNSGDMFAGLKGVDSINGIDKLNVSKVTDMSYMFNQTGSNSNIFTLNLGDKFDTSNVTNMNSMFSNTGFNSPVFTLDLGNHFDTSKVTNMSNMFADTGHASLFMTLNLGDKFDTSNVTDMSYIFEYVGYSNPLFTLNLGNKFDTKNVINMESMFDSTGYNSSVFTLDLGNKFDTSWVTNMKDMFHSTGYNSSVFTLDLGNKFDTSKVTNMSAMFYCTGYSSQAFILDLRDKFNTSNVTDMSTMFNRTGYSNPSFTLELGNKFYTNKVTSMSNMFAYTGDSNPNLVLDLSTFDFNNVTYSGMIFNGIKTTNIIYVKDAASRAWVIARNNALTTSNVLIK